jgi:hypothetical protein
VAADAAAAAELGLQYHGDGTRSIAMQTAFRESEAQTEAYTPDYVVPPGQEPEVLRLAHMRVGGRAGASLPAGREEVEAVERLRAKHAIEAALPPMTDEASFELRKRLMETVEMAAWEQRESEMATEHADRLALIEQALRTRNSEREFVAEQRVEELRRRLAGEREAALAVTQARRVKILRKLGKQRQREETHVDMLTGTGSFVGVASATATGGGGAVAKGRKATRDIIAEYADYGSRVYAPALRDGRHADKLRAAAAFEVQAPELGTVAGIGALAATLPPSATQARVAAPELPKPTTSLERADVTIGKDLERVHNMIKTVKAGKSTSAIDNEEVPSWRQPKPQVVRPPTPTFDDDDDGGAEAAEVENAVLLLQTLLRGRAVQNVMYEGKDRRLELIHEMRADLLTDEAVASLEAEEAARRAEDNVGVGRDATADTAAGEVTAAGLDFFAAELVRSRELARLSQLAAAADAERRAREGAETARRTAELAERARKAEVYRQLRAVHASAADSLVDAAMASAAHGLAAEDAGLETRVRHSLVAPIIDSLEAEAGQNTVVRDLLSALVLPAVDAALAGQAATAASAHFAAAAGQATRAASALAMAGEGVKGDEEGDAAAPRGIGAAAAEGKADS